MADCATNGRSFGEEICFLLSFASLFAFVLAMGPFQIGIWFQTESLMTGLLIAGCACSLACILVMATRSGHAGLNAPVIVILILWLGWQAAVSVFTDFPLRSWFGPPETGEGIFRTLALATLSLAALIAMRSHRRALVAASVMSVWLMLGLTVACDVGSPWRPALSADFTAILGPLLFCTIVASFGRPSWRTILAGVVAALPPLLGSGSKTAIWLVIPLFPALALLSVAIHARLPERHSRLALAALPIVAVVAISLVIPLLGENGEVPWRSSLWSRAKLAEIAIKAVANRPTTLIVGQGWGSYNDALFRNIWVDGVSFFEGRGWRPTWEGMGAGAFHSHNSFLEALLAGGIINFLLMMAILPLAVYCGHRRHRPWLATGWTLVAVVMTVWYQLPQVVPLLALALAATARLSRWRAPARISRIAAVAASPALALAAVAMAAGAWVEYKVAVDYGRLMEHLEVMAPPFAPIPTDFGRGGGHLWWVTLNTAKMISDQAKAGTAPTADIAESFTVLLSAVDDWRDSGRAGMRLASMGITLRDNLAFQHRSDGLTELRNRKMADWGRQIADVVRQAPERTDIAVQFLTWQYLTGHTVELQEFCGDVLGRQPADPVCLWFSGLAMLADPTREPQAIQRMRTALDHHADRRLPVGNAIRELLAAP